MERLGATLEPFFSQDTAVNPAEVSFAYNDTETFATLYRFDTTQRDQVNEALAYTETVSFLNSEITHAREKFLEESLTQKGRLAYAIEFDTAVYDVLNHYKWVNRRAYEEVRNDLDAQTEFNQVTLLGEIFHAELSRYTTRLQADGIYSDTGEEPMRDMIKRGAQYRVNNGSKEPERELAVVDGFLATEKILISPETPIGTTVLSVSLTGPQHEHNFYDTATKREDEKRGVYLEWRRYSSSLSRAESAQKLATFDTRYTDQETPAPEYFLRNVVTFVPGESEFSDPDKIHQYLHREHGAMSKEELAKIINENRKFREYYRIKLNDPDATYQELEDAFKAMINNALFVAGKSERNLYSEVTDDSHDASDNLPDSSQISFFAGMSMPAMSLPCGILGGMGDGGMGYGFMGAIGAYGMPFGGGNRPEDDPGLCKCSNTRPHFHCPGKKTVDQKDKETGKLEKKKVACSYKIVVGMGISTCPDCGESKKC